ncbi:TrkA C-terminal domain-containing protein [Natranaeroarchaeum aerophilus]|uniref:TrkA C-terminal domain-containing protein n=1 Tax=Natranaeroarchaeum aerophilus TaxID=2917711 RepID=A0AAE3K361_9EURY|nr:TrkA C-terminal domain-containing protein [Natranaeroarchaeum aerophilus]MCL9812111.1 TrkA C-terminal domain-containing protein [Natranaeroarchaeum aerophilus]
MTLLATVLSNPLVEAGLRIVGLSLLAAAVTTLVTYVYRVRARAELPEGATLIIGLGVVAIYLNTRLVFIQFVGETGDPFSVAEALLNVSVFVAAGVASYGGRRLGTWAGASERFSWGRLQPDFSPLVRATGRYITVTLPDEIADIEGYDPVEDETRAALAGRSLDFPRGLTLAELETGLITRLKEEHDIGYVDVDLTADGTVEYFAVGRRVAGIGPTLAPKTAAVAIRADPPFSATPGDTVQVWQVLDGEETRIGTAELRASVGPVATLATEESVAERLDPTAEYRLMTVSADSHPDREFAGMLRRGEETMSVVEIGAGSPLVGTPISALDVTVIAVRTAGGEVETIPAREWTIKVGEQLFAIGRPDVLRKLDAANAVQSIAIDGELSNADDAAVLAVTEPVPPADEE